ncbi:hypothetical protein CK203_108440 [Vitis vinifera]|uniref:G-patch domain-containing protein n=1 Tax=Vitis vinifera TaxID=29760 RepID=A0A438D6W6_VITVI|nr:hypothetical protein CK203_108440 [Vitis vinifera]
MMTACQATCIVFSDDDLPPEGSDHTHPLYISIGCSSRRVPSVLLDNGSAPERLRIPTSFNLLLGRPWIHRAGAILLPFIRRFTFDEVQTLEMEDFCRDFVVMSSRPAQQHDSARIMRSMSYIPGMGLGRRQQGPSEFMVFPDRDVPFGFGFIPTEADYCYMARLRRERVMARLTHTPFYYPVRPYHPKPSRLLREGIGATCTF